MPRIARTSLALAAAALLGGCYHAVIDTGREPSGTTISKPWAHSFVGGLVPPSVVETAQKCPAGVARVETQQSFLNLLAQGLTWGIYSPMTITVSCAKATAMAPGSQMLRVGEGTPADLLQRATALAASERTPVFVTF